MSESDRPELCPVDSFVMLRDYGAEQGVQKINPGWPMISEFAGIHPDQIDEFKKLDKKMGVPTDYTGDGDVVWRNRTHRKKYCEAHGIYDRNGGYGDPQPKYR